MLTEDLRERIDKLSHVKRQLLDRQLHRHRAASADPSAISPRAAAPTAAVPLSDAQHLVWRTQTANPNATFYHYPQALRLDGALDISALASALHYLAVRHDVLRTRFAVAGGLPYAIVDHTPGAPDLPCQELSPASASAAQLDKLLLQHVQRLFDLAHDSPLSPLLVRVAPDHHVLSLVHHFAAFDYWSLALFNRELSHCYDAYAAGSTPSLPPLPFGYADYAVWQQSPARKEGLAASSHYWRWQLARQAGAPAVPDGTSRPIPATFAADSFEFCVPAAMLQRLELLAQHENATLFMLLLASLQTLLARYTGASEIVVGTLVANRPSIETESLLGNFSNRLLLWGSLAGNPSFRQLLRRVRGTTLSAYMRQDVALDRMAADLYPGGAAQRDLFRVMFDYSNEPLAAPGLRGLAVTRLSNQGSESEYPLHVSAHRSHTHLRVRLQVRPDFEVRTAVPHMAYHWNTLLSAIADDPDRRIDTLPLTKHQAPRTVTRGWFAADPLSNSHAARL
jgi:hypothetical protein